MDSEFIIDREKVSETLNSVSWFIGDWVSQVWKLSLDGIMDYKLKKTVFGLCDAHMHIDRCFTYNPKFFPAGISLSEIADSPLSIKQDLIGEIHDGEAYREESLEERMTRQIERSIKVGTRELWATVDTTPDIGLRAFKVIKSLKEKYQDRIVLKIACYPVYGLKNPLIESDRLDVLEEAASEADFIVGLPEKDEDEGRIGFKGHTNILLDMAYRHKREVHFHVDQGNTALQRDTFNVIECLEGLTPEKIHWFVKQDKPKVWVVHVISPSCYQVEEFSRLLRLLVRYNIGVICCPSAAISMREMRSEWSPIHNSIARVMEMLRAGIKIRLGTDNVNDIFIPSGSGTIIEEISVLSNIIRNYSPLIFAKLSMGIDLDNADREALARAIYEKNKAWMKHKELMEKGMNGKSLFDY